MRVFEKYLIPAFNAPGDPAGGGGTVPENPPLENAPEAVPEKVDETSDFVLNAFDIMQRDDDEDDKTLLPRDDPPEAPETAAPEIPAAKPVTAAKPQVATTPVAQKPGDATPPEAAAPKEPAQQPGSGDQRAVPAQAEPDEKTLAGFAQALETQRGVFAKALGEKRYQLNEEDLSRLQTEPEKFIPELAGRIQVETTQSMLRVLWSQLPQIVNKIVTDKVQNERAEHAFWDLNKDLDKAKHAELVTNAGQLFRKSFKDADEAAFNKGVGSMVRGMLGMTAIALQPVANGAGQPQQLRTPGPVVRQVTPGFAPAAGAAPASASPAAQKSPWEAMTEILQADSQGMFDT